MFDPLSAEVCEGAGAVSIASEVDSDPVADVDAVVAVVVVDVEEASDEVS